MKSNNKFEFTFVPFDDGAFVLATKSVRKNNRSKFSEASYLVIRTTKEMVKYFLFYQDRLNKDEIKSLTEKMDQVNHHNLKCNTTSTV